MPSLNSNNGDSAEEEEEEEDVFVSHVYICMQIHLLVGCLHCRGNGGVDGFGHQSRSLQIVTHTFCLEHLFRDNHMLFIIADGVGAFVVQVREWNNAPPDVE